MKATFFGTGTSTGVPVIGCACEVCTSPDPRDARLRASLLIEMGDDGPNILIDAGPDFRQQMLRNGTQKIDALLLTHLHYDHVGGLDDVRGVNHAVHHPVDVYGQEATINAIKRNLYYAFEHRPYPGSPRLKLHKIDKRRFTAAGTEITPLPVMHGGLQILGFRIGSLAYITDASIVPHSTIKLMEGIDTLILNALRPTHHHSHLSLDEAIEVAHRVGARQTFFTHMSHDIGLHAWRDATLPESMALAHDGLQVDVGDTPQKIRT